jgi:predicted permease
MALSMTLLVAAGLFVKSLMNVTRVDLGLGIESLATFGVSPELNGYAPERSRDFFERLEAELAAVPGVAGVTASRVPLIAGSSWGNNVSVEGFEAGPDTDTDSRFNEIGAGFFGVLGIPLMSGREFVASDVVGSVKVAVVNEAFARKFNLGRDAVGKWMHAGRGDELDTQIIGLVQDAKYSDVKDEIPPQYFVPYRQNETIGSMSFYVRAHVPPEATLASIRDVVAGLDANLPVEELKMMEQQVRENVIIDRLVGTLSAAFAVLATVLAAVGLYGVLAYTITQRTREIGLRMALGADGRRVRAMVVKQVGWIALVGGAIGFVAALGLGRLAGSMLYELEGHDPWVLGIAAVLLLVVAAGAAFIPARQASRIDPMYALRYE